MASGIFDRSLIKDDIKEKGLLCLLCTIILLLVFGIDTYLSSISLTYAVFKVGNQIMATKLRKNVKV